MRLYPSLLHLGHGSLRNIPSPSPLYFLMTKDNSDISQHQARLEHEDTYIYQRQAIHRYLRFEHQRDLDKDCHDCHRNDVQYAACFPMCHILAQSS